jgi:DNA-binding MarR family transcriptional regulator
MILLKELPDRKNLKKLAKDNAEIDANSVSFLLQFLKTASDALVSIDRFFTSKNFSQGRFNTLMVLDEFPDGLYPHSIADQMGVSRATASGLLKGLFASGYVTVNPSETDGRMKKIMLTADGKEFLEGLIPEYYSLISRFATGLDKKTIKQLLPLLQSVETNIKAEE